MYLLHLFQYPQINPKFICISRPKFHVAMKIPTKTDMGRGKFRKATSHMRKPATASNNAKYLCMVGERHFYNLDSHHARAGLYCCISKRALCCWNQVPIVDGCWRAGIGAFRRRLSHTSYNSAMSGRILSKPHV